MLIDPRRNPRLANALRLLAPGTDLRFGINDIIKGHLGALIVIAARNEISPLISGGIELDIPFSSQMLYELAKMDGAIVLDADLKFIMRANVQLMPDASVATSETGTRHRTAERVARQTGAIVVAISQERDTVNIYTGGSRYQLDSITDVLAKAMQGLSTLRNHRAQLDRGADDLTMHELRGDVTIDDVLTVLQRAEMAARMVDEIQRNLDELGLDGRLVSMQLGELSEGVLDERMATIRDYRNSETTSSDEEAIEQIASLTYNELVGMHGLGAALGYADSAVINGSLRPRGYRALAHIPNLMDLEATQIVAAFPTFDALMRATLRELAAVDGVTQSKAADVQQGLRRLHDRLLRNAK
ncbi:MAG: DNA integrity scanning protein DisA [Thermoleophilia bacterium]|nr:DNA integrity scanning protein DisA [Thermoleophilia bacterium]